MEHCTLAHLGTIAHTSTLCGRAALFFSCSYTYLHLVAFSRLPPPFTLLSFDTTRLFCHAGGWHLRRKPSGEYFFYVSFFPVVFSRSYCCMDSQFFSELCDIFIHILIEINIYAKNLTPSSTVCRIAILLMTVLGSAKSWKSLYCHTPAPLIRHIRVTAQKKINSRATADHHVYNSSHRTSNPLSDLPCTTEESIPKVTQNRCHVHSCHPSVQQHCRSSPGTSSCPGNHHRLILRRRFRRSFWIEISATRL